MTTARPPETSSVDTLALKSLMPAVVASAVERLRSDPTLRTRLVALETDGASVLAGLHNFAGDIGNARRAASPAVPRSKSRSPSRPPPPRSADARAPRRPRPRCDVVTAPRAPGRTSCSDRRRPPARRRRALTLLRSKAAPSSGLGSAASRETCAGTARTLLRVLVRRSFVVRARWRYASPPA